MRTTGSPLWRGSRLQIKVTGIDLQLQDCSTRIPFRFGVHTLTTAPMAVATISAETSDGTALVGYTSELLVPRWFEKNLDRSVEDDIQSLIDSISRAGDVLLDGTKASTFDHYWRMLEDRVLAVPTDAADRLTRGLGVCDLGTSVDGRILSRRGAIFPRCARLQPVLYRRWPISFKPGRLEFSSSTVAGNHSSAPYGRAAG